MKPTPYYQKDNITLICADARSVLPALVDKSIALLWTDPPYNVGKDYGGWNDAMPDAEYLTFCAEWIAQAKRITKEQAVYVPTKYITEYWAMLGKAKQIILSWSPEGAYRSNFVNQFASILTTAVPKQRTKDVWHNFQRQGLGYFFRENDYGHPGYTSEDITRKVISSFTVPGDSVLDCFAGTGTSAVCAKQLGRKFLGIEINEDYLKIAIERLRQGVLL